MTVLQSNVSDAVTLNAEQKRGRAILVTIFSTVLAIHGYFTIQGALSRGFDAGAYWETGRIFLFSLLFYVVWLGQRWAKRLTIALFFLASLSVVPVLLRHFHPFVLVTFLVPAALGCVLAFSKNIKAFLTFQRKRK